MKLKFDPFGMLSHLEILLWNQAMCQVMCLVNKVFGYSNSSAPFGMDDCVWGRTGDKNLVQLKHITFGQDSMINFFE